MMPGKLKKGSRKADLRSSWDMPTNGVKSTIYPTLKSGKHKRLKSRLRNRRGRNRFDKFDTMLIMLIIFHSSSAFNFFIIFFLNLSRMRTAETTGRGPVPSEGRLMVFPFANKLVEPPPSKFIA